MQIIAKPETAQKTNFLKPEYYTYFGLASVIGLSLFLRLYRLDHLRAAGDYDEGLMYIGAAYPLNRIIPHLWPDNTPFSFFFYHFYLDLTNYTHDRTILRLPAVVMGVITTGVVYCLGWEITRNKKTALLAALFAAILPTLIDLSRSFRFYAPFLLFSALSALFLLRALRTNKWWDWAAFVLFTTLNMYNHYGAIFATFQLGVFSVIWTLLAILQLNLQKPLVARFPKLSATLLSGLSKNLTATQIKARIVWQIASYGAVFLLYIPWLGHLQIFLNDPLSQRGTVKVPFDLTTNYEFLSWVNFGDGLGFWLPFGLALLGLGWLFYRRFFAGAFCVCYIWSAWFVQAVILHTATDTLLISPRYYCYIALVYPIVVAQGIRTLNLVTVAKFFRKPLGSKKWRLQLATLVPITLLALLLAGQSFLVDKNQLLYVIQDRYLDEASGYLAQNLHPGDVVLTAAPDFYAKEFRRNNIVNENFAYILSPNGYAETSVWPYFMEFEDLASLPHLQQLQSDFSNIWLLAVLDGSDDEMTATIQKIKDVAGNSFDYHCFEPICFINVKPDSAAKPRSQLQKLQLIMQTFPFLQSDFPREAKIFSQLNLTKQQVVSISTPSKFALTANPYYVSLPINAIDGANSQLYQLKFKYQGAPDRIFVGFQDAQGHTLMLQPNEAGYKPPEIPFNQTADDGLVFQVPPNATEATAAFFGSDLPSEISDIQLLKVSP